MPATKFWPKPNICEGCPIFESQGLLFPYIWLRAFLHIRFLANLSSGCSELFPLACLIFLTNQKICYKASCPRTSQICSRTLMNWLNMDLILFFWYLFMVNNIFLSTRVPVLLQIMTGCNGSSLYPIKWHIGKYAADQFNVRNKVDIVPLVCKDGDAQDHTNFTTVFLC